MDDKLESLSTADFQTVRNCAEDIAILEYLRERHDYDLVNDEVVQLKWRKEVKQKIGIIDGDIQGLKDRIRDMCGVKK